MTADVPKRILIADDYDDAAKLLADLVERATPHTAVAAKDGYEALQMARLKMPDVAVVDVDMPRMGGIEVARALRTLPDDQRPLLIALTTHAVGARVSGLFDHVFRKPQISRIC